MSRGLSSPEFSDFLVFPGRMSNSNYLDYKVESKWFKIAHLGSLTNFSLSSDNHVTHSKRNWIWSEQVSIRDREIGSDDFQIQVLSPGLHHSSRYILRYPKKFLSMNISERVQTRSSTRNSYIQHIIIIKFIVA